MRHLSSLWSVKASPGYADQSDGGDHLPPISAVTLSLPAWPELAGEFALSGFFLEHHSKQEEVIPNKERRLYDVFHHGHPAPDK